MSAVHIKGLHKVFAEGGGIKDFTCSIAQGEYFAFLGPSGCGKTTTLRCIAGLEHPDAGTIHFDERDVTALPPEKRNAAMVFQNYALFPHMTVAQNVGFGIRARKLGRAVERERVAEALEMVQLPDYGNRSVTELSGGQQQRVALARSIAVHPDILLLDEPLSNLDAELRHATREQLALLQERLGITTIYVTHDQEEALALADRIAVLKEGVCEQVGTAKELLDHPATEFVARFLGRYRNAQSTDQ